MTREQIKKKAKEIAWQISKHYDPNACKQEWCQMAAMDMACWLLSHQWVSVSDKMPTHSESESNFVLLRTSFGCPLIGCFDEKTNVWRDENWYMIDYDITHWMPIPPLGEEGGLL